MNLNSSPTKFMPIFFTTDVKLFHRWQRIPKNSNKYHSWLMSNLFIWMTHMTKNWVQGCTVWIMKPVVWKYRPCRPLREHTLTTSPWNSKGCDKSYHISPIFSGECCSWEVRNVVGWNFVAVAYVAWLFCRIPTCRIHTLMSHVKLAHSH